MAGSKARRRLSAIAIALSGFAVALALGYSGYSALDSGAGFTDTIFRALQLFALEYESGLGPPPWQLEIARFLAPAVVFYVAIGTVFGLARERTDEARVRAFARHHNVVIGLGSIGSEIAKGLRARGLPVVGIEKDASNARLSTLRAAGVRVVRGDGTDADALESARIARADHVIVAAGSDAASLEAHSACRRALERSSEHAPVIHVLLQDVRLWKELSRLQISGNTGSGWTEFVSVPDRTARALLDRARTHGSDVASGIVVRGDGAVATRLVVHAVRAILASGSDPRVRLEGPA